MKLAILGGDPVRRKPFPAYNTIDEQEKKAGLASVPEAAKYLGVGRRIVERYMDEETLSWRPVGTQRRIPWAEIYRFCGETTDRKD